MCLTIEHRVTIGSEVYDWVLTKIDVRTSKGSYTFYMAPWNNLSGAIILHTPMCRFGMTWKWYLLAGFRSPKAMNESSWIPLTSKTFCRRVQHSAYLIHNVKFTFRWFIPTKFAWIWRLCHRIRHTFTTFFSKWCWWFKIGLYTE